MYMYMPSTKDGSIQIEIRFSRLRSYIAQHARRIILVNARAAMIQYHNRVSSPHAPYCEAVIRAHILNFVLGKTHVTFKNDYTVRCELCCCTSIARILGQEAKGRCIFTHSSLKI